MQKKKGKSKRYQRYLLFIPRKRLPCQQLMPTLPTMHMYDSAVSC